MKQLLCQDRGIIQISSKIIQITSKIIKHMPLIIRECYNEILKLVKTVYFRKKHFKSTITP